MTSFQPGTWIYGLDRNDVKELAERGFEPRLGSVYSDSANPDTSKEHIADAADGLLQLFGIDVAKWQDQIVSAEGTTTSLIGAVGESSYDGRDVRRWAAGSRLGEFLMERAWWAVPIEGGDDETGEFQLTLRLGDDTLATFRSYGEQEVYRSYLDASTEEPLDGDIEDLKERAMRGEANTDIAAIHTNIHYSVAFSTPD